MRSTAVSVRRKWRKPLTFLSGKDIWNTFSDLSENCKSVQCAVAYTSECSSIRFKRGDLLITDASDESIKGGQTSAKELQMLKNIGVRIYSKPLLHAKLYVFTDRMVIGSCNLSASSKNRLIESAVLLRDEALISDAIQFLSELTTKSEEVTDEFIERILKLPVQRTQSTDNEELNQLPGKLWRLRTPPNALSTEMKCYFHALIVAQLGELSSGQEFTLWSSGKKQDAFRAHLDKNRIKGGSGRYSLTEEGVEYFSARKLDKEMVKAFLSAIRTGSASELPESLKDKGLIPLT